MASNIIGFDQPAEFYYNSALKYIDEHNYIDALPYLRKAMEKDPDNVDYNFDYAEILSEMGKYEESNAVFFELIEKGDEPPVCYYGMGCNFIGIGDFERAKDCFEEYINADEDGFFYDDAVEFIKYIEGFEDDFDPGLVDLGESDDLKHAGEGSISLSQGNFQQAIEELSKVKEEDFTFAKNNLSLALYLEGREDDAIEVAEELLKREPENIHAICNMIVFCAGKGEHARTLELIDRLDAVNVEDPDDMFKMGVTFSDIEIHDKAFRWFKEYLKYNPYDGDTIFMTGIAASNSGNLSDAIDYFSTCLKIDPHNSVAKYYIGAINEAIDSGEEPPAFEYALKVPDEEAERRLGYINDCFGKTREDVVRLWKEDESFEEYLVWGLENCDDEYRLAVATVLADFGDKKAEKVLRKFILNPYYSDDVKNQIFILLKKMGAPEPYRAYMDGNIVDIAVSAAPKELQDLKDDDK